MYVGDIREEIKLGNLENIPLRKAVEGRAELWVPDVERIYDAPVFYNPKMSLNRDLSIVALKVLSNRWDKKLFVYEPLGGIGVRAIRTLMEIPENVSHYLSNDINSLAISLGRKNAKTNAVNPEFTNQDARWQMAELRKHPLGFPSVIDLDPFGAPTPFLDAVSYGFSRESAVFVTATDMAPLCGVYPETCYVKYHGFSARVFSCHEFAVRILLQFIALTAARRGYGIHPILSFSTDHYVRAKVVLRKGKTWAKKATAKIGFAIVCPRCGETQVEELVDNNDVDEHLCPVSREKEALEKIGPIWLGDFFDHEFVKDMQGSVQSFDVGLDQKPRVAKLLKRIASEANMPIGFYRMDRLGKGKTGNLPPMTEIIEKLRVHGFKASLTHFHPQGIKTNASPDEVMSIVL